ncbi:MAG TPA: acyltransferase [Methylophilaceae bacterium]
MSDFYLKHDQRYLWFDLIRGLAAMMVCFSHLRVVVLEDYGQITSPSSIDKLIYYITGLGHQSVMMFFVLSGFFVGGSVLRNIDKFNWFNYMVARISRLWVVLIPALLLTYLVGLTLAGYAPSVLSGQFNEIWHSGPNSGEYSTSFVTLIGNVFFLQTIISPVFGVNGPLWSLANEFWYYLLFPMVINAMGGFTDYSNKLLKMLSLALAITIFMIMPVAMRYGFLIWVFGVCLYWALQRWVKLGALYTSLTAILFFGLLFYSKLHVGQSIDIVLGASFATFCLGLAHCEAPKTCIRCFTKISRGLSEISYSLYLSHFPLVLLIGVFYYPSARMVPSFASYTQLIAWFLLLVLVGSAFWWLFERHTNQFRVEVMKALKLK